MAPFAAAGDFALQGHDVQAVAARCRRGSGASRGGSRIVVKDAKGRHDAQLALVTTDIAEAVRDAELILVPPRLSRSMTSRPVSRRISAMGRWYSCRRRHSAP